MHRRMLMLILPALLCCPWSARAEFELKDDDRVLFFGDTLVFTQGFSSYVETFIQAKYPDLKARFFNYGQPRQTAADGLKRLQGDLTTIAPTVVVVSFGMFDPEKQAFDEGKLTEFRKNYVAMVKRIKELPARLVLITPPHPVANRLRGLESVDYAAVVAQYAQAVREIAATNQVPVLDWFESSSALYKSAKSEKSTRITREELLPPRLAHAVLAAQLLKAWRAEPIELNIDIDWNSDQATVSDGTIDIKNRTANELAVELTGVPLPWALPGVKAQALQAADWPGSELCRYMLTIRNIPEGGLQLMLGGKGLPIEPRQPAEGINITGWQPIQTHNAALRDLLQTVARKHRYRLDLRRVTRRRPKEPELQEAFESHLRTLELYEEGTIRIIKALPKTFDVLLTFQVRPEQASKPTIKPPAGE